MHVSFLGRSNCVMHRPTGDNDIQSHFHALCLVVFNYFAYSRSAVVSLPGSGTATCASLKFSRLFFPGLSHTTIAGVLE